MTPNEREELVRCSFAAYMTVDRADIEAILPQRFHLHLAL